MSEFQGDGWDMSWNVGYATSSQTKIHSMKRELRMAVTWRSTFDMPSMPVKMIDDCERIFEIVCKLNVYLAVIVIQRTCCNHSLGLSSGGRSPLQPPSSHLRGLLLHHLPPCLRRITNFLDFPKCVCCDKKRGAEVLDKVLAILPDLASPFREF
ncbi:hypothetical protein SCHPADRAFT_233978 [Schizopora paradoxa]|uniref:Uncharacterized protein n=1 Tax=Schizopora paradoxa TaxID=27342 RepID=A0A0H2RWT1_9AGAM|nr:hypothetical protein SCHPADRAFT_233978 [Schizopora paradoxa]